MVVGGVSLAVPDGSLSLLSVMLFDKIPPSDVVVTVGKALCVTCDSEDSDKAESALCKTDKASRVPVGSGWYVKAKLVAVVSDEASLSAVEGNSPGCVGFGSPSSVAMLLEISGEVASADSVVYSGCGNPIFVVVGSSSSGV